MARTRAFLNFLLFLGASLLPIYLYGSGNLQPTHAILLVFSLSVMLRHGFTPARWNVTFLVLALYGLLIETANVAGGAKPDSLMNPMFFVYNFILSYSVWQFCRLNGDRALSRGIVVAAVIGILSVGIFGVELIGNRQGIRETGGFNNPNQLGYFAVCLLSLAYLFRLRGSYSQWTTYGLYAVAVFLAIASLSKAAIVATFIVLFLASNPRMTREFILPWLIGGLVAGFAVFYVYTTGGMDDYLFAQRLEGMGEENDSSLESRGYFAFLDADPLRIIIGLGSHQVMRILDHEVHSTIASVFNVFGLIGGILFVSLLYQWAKTVYRNYGVIPMLCIVGPAMLYGITHNGSRFAIFWILVALSMVPRPAEQPTSKVAAPERPSGVPIGAPGPRGIRRPAREPGLAASNRAVRGQDG